MERFILKKLLDWKNSPYRKPLILKGVRQAGKTWILKEFGRRYYENTAYFNFDEKPVPATSPALKVCVQMIFSSAQQSPLCCPHTDSRSEKLPLLIITFPARRGETPAHLSIK